LVVVGSPKTPDVAEVVHRADVHSAKFIDAGAESPGTARNTGIERASGEFLAYLDDDETWDEDKITRQIDRLSSTGAGVCHTGVRKVGPNGELRAVSKPTVEGKATKTLLTNPPYGAISAMILRRDLAQIVNGFDEDFTLLEENDFNIRVAEHTTFCTVSEPLVTRYIEGHQQTTDDLEQTLLDSDRLIQKHRELAREFGTKVEQQMIARVKSGAGKTAANQGRYLTAARLFWNAINQDPRNPSNFLYFGLVAGGPVTYKTAQYTKRTIIRIIDSIDNQV
jgi:glycosyltransferase involved in cell wall biosynthesis